MEEASSSAASSHQDCLSPQGKKDLSLLEEDEIRTTYDIPILDLTAPCARTMEIVPHISTNTNETNGFDSSSGHISHSASQYARPRTSTSNVLESHSFDGKAHQAGICRGRSPTVRGHIFVVENSK